MASAIQTAKHMQLERSIPCGKMSIKTKPNAMQVCLGFKAQTGPWSWIEGNMLLESLDIFVHAFGTYVFVKSFA